MGLAATLNPITDAVARRSALQASYRVEFAWGGNVVQSVDENGDRIASISSSRLYGPTPAPSMPVAYSADDYKAERAADGDQRSTDYDYESDTAYFEGLGRGMTDQIFLIVDLKTAKRFNQASVYFHPTKANPRAFNVYAGSDGANWPVLCGVYTHASLGSPRQVTMDFDQTYAYRYVMFAFSDLPVVEPGLGNASPCRVAQVELYEWVDESDRVVDKDGERQVVVSMSPVSAESGASAGTTAQIELENVDGRYSPWNASSPIYGSEMADGMGSGVRSGVPCRVTAVVTDGGTEYATRLFEGRVSNREKSHGGTGVELDVSAGVASFSCRTWLASCLDAQVSTPVYIGARFSAVLLDVLARCGLPPQLVEAQDVAQAVPYLTFSGETGGSVLEQAAKALPFLGVYETFDPYRVRVASAGRTRGDYDVSFMSDFGTAKHLRDVVFERNAQGNGAEDVAWLFVNDWDHTQLAEVAVPNVASIAQYKRHVVRWRYNSEALADAKKMEYQDAEGLWGGRWRDLVRTKGNPITGRRYNAGGPVPVTASGSVMTLVDFNAPPGPELGVNIYRASTLNDTFAPALYKTASLSPYNALIGKYVSHAVYGSHLFVVTAYDANLPGGESTDLFYWRLLYVNLSTGKGRFLITPKFVVLPIDPTRPSMSKAPKYVVATDKYLCLFDQEASGTVKLWAYGADPMTTPFALTERTLFPAAFTKALPDGRTYDNTGYSYASKYLPMAVGAAPDASVGKMLWVAANPSKPNGLNNWEIWSADLDALYASGAARLDLRALLYEDTYDYKSQGLCSAAGRWRQDAAGEWQMSFYLADPSDVYFARLESTDDASYVSQPALHGMGKADQPVFLKGTNTCLNAWWAGLNVPSPAQGPDESHGASPFSWASPSGSHAECLWVLTGGMNAIQERYTVAALMGLRQLTTGLSVFNDASALYDRSAAFALSNEDGFVAALDVSGGEPAFTDLRIVGTRSGLADYIEELWSTDTARAEVVLVRRNDYSRSLIELKAPTTCLRQWLASARVTIRAYDEVLTFHEVKAGLPTWTNVKTKPRYDGATYLVPFKFVTRGAEAFLLFDTSSLIVGAAQWPTGTPCPGFSIRDAAIEGQVVSSLPTRLVDERSSKAAKRLYGAGKEETLKGPMICSPTFGDELMAWGESPRPALREATLPWYPPVLGFQRFSLTAARQGIAGKDFEVTGYEHAGFRTTVSGREVLDAYEV
jgi:hypothetical protein